MNVHGGALQTTITGGITGTVTVTGPANFTQTIVASQTIQVAPGTYTVTASPATSGSIRYWPAAQSQLVGLRCRISIGGGGLLHHHSHDDESTGCSRHVD